MVTFYAVQAFTDHPECLGLDEETDFAPNFTWAFRKGFTVYTARFILHVVFATVIRKHYIRSIEDHTEMHWFPFAVELMSDVFVFVMTIDNLILLFSRDSLHCTFRTQDL